ncbi:MAG: polysaccharide deacetylase family protein [Candidatus Hermodarchaeota archaeon]
MKIALTFDIERDIPNFLDTDFGLKIGLPKILTLLNHFHIKSTFFCTGNVIERQPNIINLIEKHGHEIACHSLNHERLKNLSFEQCKEIILKSKDIIENRCPRSEIIGFRAPYLKPPRFLLLLLDDLNFKYDSSIKSRKKSEFSQIKNYEIREFHPSSYNVFFRLPISFYLIRKWILRKKLMILYFHSWEAVNIKALMFNQKKNINLFFNSFFRLDRWINTGNPFIKRLRIFINDALTKKVEFVTLKNLCTHTE